MYSRGSVTLLLPICALLWLSWAGAVRAELPAAFPCRETDLVDALAARVPELPWSSLDFSLLDGRVLVRFGARVRVVELAGTRGKDAARVLALVIADLALQPDPSTAPTGGAGAEGAARAQRSAALAPAPVPQRTDHPTRTGARAAVSGAPSVERDRARWAIDLAGQRGLNREEPWSLDVGVGGCALFFERLVLGARAGYMHVPTVRSVSTGTAVRFDALTLRAVVGVRIRLLDLSIGPNFVPFWVRGGEGHHDVLPGANLQLALWLPLVRSLRLVARLCIDVFGNRTRVYAGSDAVLTTPRSMAGLALGFGWGST